MTEQVTRLANILADRFFVPKKTDGMNVLMNFGELVKNVSKYWKMEDNWSITDLEEAILETQIPFIININNQRVFILIEQ